MLKICELCEDRKTLSYEDLVQVCGRCREVKKADLIDSAIPKDPFHGKRWNGGKCSLLDYNEIKKLRNEGYTQQKIADIYGVKQATICLLLKRGK